jgi:hypothetical protein
MDKLPVTLQFLPPTKQREKDTVLRMMCVEILLLLATSEWQVYERRWTVQPSLVEKPCDNAARTTSFESCTRWRRTKRWARLNCPRWLYQIKDSIERLVGLLQRDEGGETQGDHVDELVKASAADAAGEMDVVEV